MIGGSEIAVIVGIILLIVVASSGIGDGIRGKKTKRG
jgi:hypothetical protein